MESSEPAAATPPGASASGEAVAPTRGDLVLVVVFWVWAGLLALATLAQLLGWEQVLDRLDVKRWF
jgi:hypothetical protein